jgi:GTPase SAR1 family protein
MIGLCGAPKVGKTETLERLCSLLGVSTQSSHEIKPPDRIISLAASDVEIHTAPGVLIYRDAAMKKVVSKVDAIIYVISADPCRTDQEGLFQRDIRMAKRLKKTWNDVPWLFVLNKTDLGNDHSIISELPAELRQSMVRTVALTGEGIDQLWQRILLMSKSVKVNSTRQPAKERCHRNRMGAGTASRLRSK